MSIAMEKATVLVVDDTPENIDVLAGILKSDYRVKAALSGEKALNIAVSDNPPDIILLDIMMPGMDGYQVARALKKDPATSHIPIVFVSAMNEPEDEQKGLELGAVDYLTKPVKPVLVKARVHNHLQLKLYENHLEELIRQKTRDVEKVREATIFSLTALAETRDNDTGGHILRTQRYVQALAVSLQSHPRFCDDLDDASIDLLHKSAPLHDIGKVGVADAVLLKPGRLSTLEFEAMKKHTLYGQSTILKAEEALTSRNTDDFLHLARQIAYTHHERWDGAGYPEGLAGDDIPVAGRIMAVADVYDALISKRVYKSPMPYARAVDIIHQASGTQFDPLVVEAFLDEKDQYRDIALAFADHDEERSALEKR